MTRLRRRSADRRCRTALYAALFSAIFAALVDRRACASARSVDAASDAAIEAVRAARDERVRADERARVNGLVHDHVLTTLLVAARSPLPTESGAADAADALRAPPPHRARGPGASTSRHDGTSCSTGCARS